MEPSKAQRRVTRHLHTFVPDSGPEYDYRTNPPLWSGEKARARCTGCGVRPWLSRGDLAAYAAMELAAPAQDVTKCDSDHEEKQPGRVFTPEELVRGPDDFPYTPEGEMTQFHEQRDAATSDRKHEAKEATSYRFPTDEIIASLSDEGRREESARAIAAGWSADEVVETLWPRKEVASPTRSAVSDHVRDRAKVTLIYRLARSVIDLTFSADQVRHDKARALRDRNWPEVVRLREAECAVLEALEAELTTENIATLASETLRDLSYDPMEEGAARAYDREDHRKLGKWVQANLQHRAGSSWSEGIAAEVEELRAKAARDAEDAARWRAIRPHLSVDKESHPDAFPVPMDRFTIRLNPCESWFDAGTGFEPTIEWMIDSTRVLR